MKNKFVLMLFSIASIILLSPSISHSYIYYPSVDLRVVVNTQNENGLFNFKIQQADNECYIDNESKEIICNYTGNWSDMNDLSLQTENLTASQNFSWINYTKKYRILQNENDTVKLDNISCISDTSKVTFSYYENGVEFLITPSPGSASDSYVTCTFDNKKNINPVLIVPGVVGTEMFNGPEKLWPDVTRMVNPFNNDSFMDALQFKDNLTVSNSNVSIGEVVKNPNNVFDYSEGLINEFKNQGYKENENLFAFPYDWRYGVSGKYADGKTNSDLLKERIQAIMTQTGSDKVDVVAHSMGGLIVKKYVVDNSTNSHINKAVFVGVPNTGSVKSVKTLLQGDNFGVIGLNDEEIKKIAENMPALYDLLPTQEYDNDNGSYLKTVNIKAGEETIEKDLNYQEAKSFLTDKEYNALAISNAENLHVQSFDNFDLQNTGISLYSINGCKTATLGKITETNKTNIFGITNTTYQLQSVGEGDGTVSMSSAENLPVSSENIFYAIKADHGKMPSQNGIRQKIVNLILNSNLATGNIITKKQLEENPAQCQISGFLLKLLSPVSIEVTDQNGNSAGLAQDGSIKNDIPGASYEIMGDEKFVFLPTDENQTYTVGMQGTGVGTYTIKVQDIVNSRVGSTQVFSNLPVTPQLTGQINLSSSQTTLAVKQTPASNAETILPSATLTQQQSEDLIAPVSTATLAGTAGQDNFYRTDVSVKIAATDNSAGVLAIEYNLDDEGFKKVLGESATFSVSKEGKHKVVFFSTDKAGNNELEKTIEFTIDKTAPEAVIEFDKTAKDLKFSGKDNISDSSSITVLDKGDVITLTDQSGNKTEIQLLNKNRKVLRTVLGVKSIKYNSVPAKVSGLMAFSWVYDWRGNLVALTQSALSKNGYAILAIYDSKNTRITGRDSSGVILKTIKGLKTIKVSSNKGDLQWAY